MRKGERQSGAEGYSDALHSVPVGPVERVVPVARVSTKVALQPQQELGMHATSGFHGEDAKGSTLVSVKLPSVAVVRNLAPASLVSRVPVLQSSLVNMA